MSDGPARPPASPSDQPPTPAGGSSAGRPLGELPPPQDPFLSEIDAPSVPPAAPAGPAAPGTRRPRVIDALPVWGLVALGVVVVVVGLVVVPSVAPWWRAPVESPLDGPVPAIGALGDETPKPVSVVEVSTSPSTSSEPTAGPTTPRSSVTTRTPGATQGPGAPSDPPPPNEPPPSEPADPGSPDPSDAPTTPAPDLPQGLEIAQFGASPLPGNGGYRVFVEIANRRTVPQAWQNLAVYVNGWVSSVTVEKPQDGVRAYPAVSRVCLAPTDPSTAQVGPGGLLTIEFIISGQLSHSVTPARLNDAGCLSAES